MFKEKDSREYMLIDGDLFHLSDDVNNPIHPYRDKLFHLEVEDYSRSPNVYDDSFHSYVGKLNSKGYRSPEFEKVELITLGCSQTFGLGVCVENSWPKVLAESLGYSYANLARPGWSINKAIMSFYAYVKEYGPPKAVALLIPDLYRITYASRTGYAGPGTDVNEETIIPRNSDGSQSDWNLKDVPILSKRPHALADILTAEVPMLQAFQALNTFLMFCSASGIAVSIDSWNPPTYMLLKDLDYLKDEILSGSYPNHSEVMEKDYSYRINLCELHSPSDMAHPHPKEWKAGTDLGVHMGAHEHLHRAKAAFVTLKNQLDILNG